MVALRWLMGVRHSCDSHGPSRAWLGRPQRRVRLKRVERRSWVGSTAALGPMGVSLWRRRWPHSGPWPLIVEATALVALGCRRAGAKRPRELALPYVCRGSHSRAPALWCSAPATPAPFSCVLHQRRSRAYNDSNASAANNPDATRHPRWTFLGPSGASWIDREPAYSGTIARNGGSPWCDLRLG